MYSSREAVVSTPPKVPRVDEPEFQYDDPAGQTRSCRVRIFPEGEGAVVILTETLDDATPETLSFCLTQVATDVVRTYQLADLPIVWIEHVDERSSFLRELWGSDRSPAAESLFQVRFATFPHHTALRERAREPISREEVQRLIGEPLD